MSYGLGSSNMRQRRGPSVSRKPVMMGFSVVMQILTAYFENVTVKLASHIGPTPTRYSWKPGMTCPVVDKSEGS